MFFPVAYCLYLGCAPMIWGSFFNPFYFIGETYETRRS